MAIPHPLVLQLRFTRSEFERALRKVDEADGLKRLGAMNSISWIVGHLAWHEQLSWLTRGQGMTPVQEVNELANGKPASTPPLAEMWHAWRTITAASDPWLDELDSARLATHLTMRTPPYEPYKESLGSQLRRVTYHYWYHIGESQAIRQLLGHEHLPSFVGDIHDKAPYVAEEGA